MKKKTNWGGARVRAGRPKGSGPYKEETSSMRIPKSKISLIKEWLKASPEASFLNTFPNIYPLAAQLSLHNCPLYSTKVAAGFPSPADEHVERGLDLNDYLVQHPAATFFVRVQGDSMIGAGIHENDILVVDRSLEATDGKVVIAVLNGELTVKRLQKKGQKVFLVAENSKYPPLAISEEMAFQIWGVVTNVIHALSSPPHIFALIDCNNFFVSCERVFQPNLEGKPVIVLSNNDGCVISRSNEAKALEISMGQPLFQLRHLVARKDIKVFSSNFTLYRDFSRRVMQTLKNLVPSLEIYSVDEAFLDLTGFEAQLDAYSQHLVNTVYRWTGIPTSLGIGSTKTLAKAANYLAKKKGLKCFHLLSSKQQNFHLSQIPISAIWGVGRQWSKKLEMRGIQNAQQLKEQDPTNIKNNFNSTLANTVSELQGISCDLIKTENHIRQQIQVARSFSRPIHEFSLLKQTLVYHITQAAEKLRSQNSLVKSLTILLEIASYGPEYTKEQLNYTMALPYPTQDTRILIAHTLKELEHLYKQGVYYKKSGVILQQLIKKAAVQRDFFETLDLTHSEQLMSSIDKINQLMGKGTLYYAAEGIEKNWRAKAKHCSPAYTTRWSDLKIVR